jgi:DNA processing protein
MSHTAAAPTDACDCCLSAAWPAIGMSASRRGLARAGVWALCRHADLYPAQLLDLEQGAPPVLSGRGDAVRLSELEPHLTVTLVGSRRASAYGLEVAGDLGLMLARAGLPVVSGMAYGIDAAAQRGALEGGGLSVAVLAGSPESPSPAGQAALHRRLCAAGLVISEAPPETQPRAFDFPARNRIMAALGRITVVVEAAERSGSLITARVAAEIGRDVGAVPGPVNRASSAGANKLLADGAFVVRDAQDVLDALLGPGRSSARICGAPLEPELASVLDLVERGQATCDAIAAHGGGDAPAAATALARLELLGYVEAEATGRYRRTTLTLPLDE